MTSREIKKKIAVLKKNYGFTGCNYKSLKNVAEKQGYTVIGFNHIFNDEAVRTLIDALNISEDILRSRGFAYADGSYRLIFIHEDLNDDEKTMVLAHEIGHIVLEHMSNASIIGKDVREEYEANEFAHYLLKITPADKISEFLKKHKKVLIGAGIAVLLVLAVIAVVGVIKHQQKYYGEYYITSSGNRFHEEKCIFVKDKTNTHRLTVEELEENGYEPCDICLP